MEENQNQNQQTPKTNDQAAKTEVKTQKNSSYSQSRNFSRDSRSRRGDREDRRSRNRGGGVNLKKRKGLKGRNRNSRKNSADNGPEIQSKVIQVRRVTRVVKGGKRMRFSALVVVGDGEGSIGYAIKKGLDFQDSVNKATTKAKQTMFKVSINEDGSVQFPSLTKYKSSIVYLKPAKAGTGLIAGGFVRPVIELAGIKNLYSKIVGSRNKIAGTQSVIEALKKYKLNTNLNLK